MVISERALCVKQRKAGDCCFIWAPLMHAPYPHPRCLLCPVSVPDGGQPAGDHFHHLPAAPGHHPAPTYALVAPLSAPLLGQPKDMLPHCTPEGK